MMCTVYRLATDAWCLLQTPDQCNVLTHGSNLVEVKGDAPVSEDLLVLCSLWKGTEVVSITCYFKLYFTSDVVPNQKDKSIGLGAAVRAECRCEREGNLCHLSDFPGVG